MQQVSPELELLDQLGGGPEPYLLMERFVFDGHRSQALQSIEQMQLDGVISLSIDGERVEAWRLSAWRRAPDDPSTIEALQHAVLSITDLGVSRS